jgi:phenylacetate-coenzyme A ligase PaaK-like adenylate-forming protein
VPYNFKLINSDYPGILHPGNFADMALQLFRYQYHNNPIYRQFVQALKIKTAKVKTLQHIPFLPISFFKTHKVVTGRHKQLPLVFESSGTTGEATSRHYAYDEHLYMRTLIKGFKRIYGLPEKYVFIGLLPSYLERETSSLVYMAKVLMKESGHPDCGFYLNEFDKLADVLRRLEMQKQPVILLGVTFALLDFAKAYPMQLKNTIVMETGGMKGRRIEWTRPQVHEYLKEQLHVSTVQSEYGMTEMLSQAYAKSDGIFDNSPTMIALVRDINDPLTVDFDGTGCLNIIDMANVHSCAFIATDDIGIVYDNGTFEVLGRADHTALRGCNLMVL